MMRPSMQTLKHIVLNIYVVTVLDDPLFGIPSEFEDMGSKNIIETVTIMVRMNASYHRGEDWGRLDEVLTAQGWFPLKRVSLTIKINFELSSELEVTLRNLPETQFPRLSSSNSVSFDFEVIPV